MFYDNWYKVHGDSCEKIIEVDDEQNPLQTLIKTDIHENIIKSIKCFPERETQFWCYLIKKI